MLEFRIASSCFLKALLLSLAFASCFTPPVILAAHNPGWTLETSHYPSDATIVDCESANGPTLRGLFVPSDEGAPLVVHFAESGASISASLHVRGQYEALAEIGFASLAIDYRSVGLSDGEPAPKRIAEDARRIYAHALELVDGVESRLLLRGTSIGSVAVAALLADGAQPGAVIIHAPILAETVAVRFGFATRWDPLVWLVRPFLSSFSDASLVDELAKCSAPLFVSSHPNDELLNESEFRQLKKVVESGGGLFVVRKSSSFSFGTVPGHIRVTLLSYKVYPEERRFLEAAFAGTPDVEARLAKVFKEGDRDAVARALNSPAIEGRLRALVARTRKVEANVLLAAAIQLADVDQALLWLAPSQTPWSQKEGVYNELSFAELTNLFNLSDPSGELPIEAVVYARQSMEQWGIPSARSESERWPLERVLVFARGLNRPEVWDQAFADAKLQEDLGTQSLRIYRDSRGWLRVSSSDLTGASRTGGLDPEPLNEALETAEELSVEDRERRLTRVLLIATGHPHTVIQRNGAWVLEVGDSSNPQILE